MTSDKLIQFDDMKDAIFFQNSEWEDFWHPFCSSSKQTRINVARRNGGLEDQTLTQFLEEKNDALATLKVGGVHRKKCI